MNTTTGVQAKMSSFCCTGSSGSLFNEEEVQAVEVEVIRLIATGIPPGDIGVVTPYAAQKTCLCEALEPLGGGVKMDIQTVDGFQGRCECTSPPHNVVKDTRCLPIADLQLLHD